MDPNTAARAVESGQRVVVRDADFAADFASIRYVRTTVFVDEQHVPLDVEFDERDALCRHVLALDNGAPVGTARLDLDYGGKVGRLAVVANRRRAGVGRALMERLHAIAHAHGVAKLWCHAQLTAVPFYERLGYRPLGPVFEEAGIDHMRMELDLG